MSNRVRGCAALFALVGLVGGMPVALVRLVGRPWPRPFPPLEVVWQSIRRGDISDATVAKTLAVVIWIAWARLSISIGIELVARLAGASVPRVMGLGRAQQWAAALVATVVLLVAATPRIALASSSSISPGPRPISAALLQHEADVDRGPNSMFVSASQVTTPAVGPVAEHPRAVHHASQDVAGPQPVTHVVQRHESFWSMAEDSLGDGSRWREIVAMNAGREVAPGVVFDGTANRLLPGWVLVVPGAGGSASTSAPDVATVPSVRPGELIVVQPGDTLSAIAGEQLGEADDWPLIWQANRDRHFGNRVFDDPDLILPGWELIVPEVFAPPAPPAPSSTPVAPLPVGSDAESPAIASVEQHPLERSDAGASAATTPVAMDPVATAPAAMDPVALDPVALDPVVTASSTTAPAVTASAGTTSAATASSAVIVSSDVLPAATTPAPQVSVADVGRVASGVKGEVDSAAPVESADGPALGGVGAAMLLATGMVGAIAVRRRRQLRAATVHARLVRPAGPAADIDRLLRQLDAGERLARLDISLRAIAHELRTAAPGVVVLGAIFDSDGTIDVLLDGAAPTVPSPWQSVTDHRWRLPSAVAIEALGPAARQVQQPCPALAHLGSTPLDGTRSGEVFVDLEALGVLAVDAPARAATAIVRAIAAGVAVSPLAETAQLITCGLGDDHLGHPSAESAVAVGAALALATQAIGATSALTAGLSTFVLRSRQPSGEAWEPTVVVAADSAIDVSDDALVGAAPGGQGIALVVGRAVTGARWEIRAEADRWVLHPLGLEITPVGVEAVDVEQMQRLLDHADLILLSHDSDSDSGFDSDFGFGFGSDPESGSDPASLPPYQPLPRPGTDAVAPVDQVDPPGPPQSGKVPLTPLAGESAPEPLAEAVTEWKLMVRVLGQVEVVDAAHRPAPFERSKALELVAWLSQHRERSTRAGARTALWETTVRDTTFANVVSDARRTMARLVVPANGEEWIARTLTDVLPLHRGVVTDAEVLAACLRGAATLPAEEAIAVLHPGLALVRDIPFAGTAYLWPDTEGITSELILLVTTAAAVLAAHHLSRGDVAGVFWATGQGLKVLPGHEELISLRMRAYGRQGDLAGVRHVWDSYERVLGAETWGDGSPAPKLVALRRELLAPSLTDV